MAPKVLDCDAEGNVTRIEVLSTRRRMAGAYHGMREAKSAAE